MTYKIFHFLIFLLFISTNLFSSEVVVTLVNGKIVSVKWYKEITQKLEQFKNDSKALYHLLGLARKNNSWELTQQYRKKFLDAGLINNCDGFKNPEVYPIIRCSILKEFPVNHLICPLKKEPSKIEAKLEPESRRKREVLDIEKAWNDKASLSLPALKDLQENTQQDWEELEKELRRSKLEDISL